MELSRTSKIALASVKKNWKYTFLIFILFGLLCFGLFVASGYAKMLPMLLIYPFVIMPFLFSSQYHSYVVLKGSVPSFSRQIKSFLAYFVAPFRGVYSFIFNFLLSFVAFLLLSLIFSYAGLQIARSIVPTFDAFYEQLQILIRSQSFEAVRQYLLEHDYEVNVMMNSMLLPSVGLASLVFIYLVNTTAFGCYLRLDHGTVRPDVLKYFCRINKKANSKAINKMFFTWGIPLLVLYIGGFCLGLFVTLQFTVAYYIVFGFAFGTAMLLMSLYYPVYFSFLETIYVDSTGKQAELFMSVINKQAINNQGEDKNEEK